MSSVRRGPSIVLVSASTIVIIFAIVITAAVHGGTEKQFSQVITVGPVWPTNSWTCTSDADFTIDAVIIAYDEPNELLIIHSERGTQPDFKLMPMQMESFSVGGPADSTITLTTVGTMSGFITLQTTSDATASCTPI